MMQHDIKYKIIAILSSDLFSVVFGKILLYYDLCAGILKIEVIETSAKILILF